MLCHVLILCSFLCLCCFAFCVVVLRILRCVRWEYVIRDRLDELSPTIVRRYTHTHSFTYSLSLIFLFSHPTPTQHISHHYFTTPPLHETVEYTLWSVCDRLSSTLSISIYTTLLVSTHREQAHLCCFPTHLISTMHTFMSLLFLYDFMMPLWAPGDRLHNMSISPIWICL